MMIYVKVQEDHIKRTGCSKEKIRIFYPKEPDVFIKRTGCFVQPVKTFCTFT